ncbi:MAG: hypothetical protein ABIG28_00575 [archaeon]
MKLVGNSGRRIGHSYLTTEDLNTPDTRKNWQDEIEECPRKMLLFAVPVAIVYAAFAFQSCNFQNRNYAERPAVEMSQDAYVEK